MSHTRVNDEVAINAMMSEMYQAWAANDADGFVRYYADDATAILPGSLRGSRKAIRDSMAAGFDGPLKGSSTVDRQLSLRFVGEDAAIADQRGRDPVCRRGRRPGGAKDSRDLGVREAGWSMDGRRLSQQSRPTRRSTPDRVACAAYRRPPAPTPPGGRHGDDSVGRFDGAAWARRAAPSLSSERRNLW